MVSLCGSVLENSAVNYMETPEVRNVEKHLEMQAGNFLENSLGSFLVSSMGNCAVKTLMRT